MAPSARPCVSCEKPDGKYKCPRCSKYTCSVPCFTQHRDNHPPDEPKLDPPPPPPAAPAVESDPTPLDPSNPFSLLAASPELKQLFQKYPKLPGMLLRIAESTDPPSEEKDNGLLSKAGFQKRGNKQPWTQDVGMQKGVKALQRAKQLPGADSEGILEYCELVKMLLERQQGQNAQAKVHEAIASDDANTIAHLLRIEKR